ncbi:cyclic peptide export ABC transporter [Chitinophaga sp. GbtcB8]|uniref:cyclic peptide export ABC transporter n=1 Tax=Chitinophaga sp. GbtcB8 TaxID=2824753 RepID=UPI001C2F5D59|nr:cyclic peptide export ABC transporter [Chitinophaga sp. GbtcB8]
MIFVKHNNSAAIKAGCFLLLLLFITSFAVKAHPPEDALLAKIDQFVQQQMNAAGIPGVAVTVIRDKQLLLSKGYGYANAEDREPVTPNTLFEIGSNSKAFTALGILYLEKRGSLSLNDPVTKYLPWLKLPFTDDAHKEVYPEIKLRNLLYHTSGIPFNSIKLFKSGTGADELENTIKRLSGTQLVAYPGEQYLYATINYDILGLIIQQVAGQPYEQFISAQILQPLGLAHTVLFREDAKEKIARGYKYYFLQVKPYNAPAFRGNTPAGYILSNSVDMVKWMRFQLSLLQNNILSPLIERSHVPDYTSRGNAGNTFYAGGWLVYNGKRKLIMHNGNNPNYSSSIVLDSSRQTGILILANLNTTVTQHIAEGIYDILAGREVRHAEKDIYKGVNTMAGLLLLLSIVFSGATLLFLLQLIREMRAGERAAHGSRKLLQDIKFGGPLIFMAGLAYCLYLVPAILYSGLTWDFFTVWAPDSFSIAIKALYGSFLLFFTYFLINNLFPKTGAPAYYSLVILALLSGIGNAVIIYSINASLNEHSTSILGLLSYFIFGLFTYLYTRRLLSEQMIALTNARLFSMKKGIVNKLLDVPFSTFEKISREHFFLVMNNDINEVSQFPAVMVQMATGIVTLICCFIYLGMVNIWGLCMSGIAILVVCTLYYTVSQSANKIMRQSLDIQRRVMQYVDDMWKGFKELKMNVLKRAQIEKDFTDGNDQHRSRNITAQLQFANAFVIGELSFSFIFCIVIFLFPVIFVDLQKDELRSYVFIFLYMNGPVNIVLNAVPNLTRIKVSWNHILQFRKHFGLEDTPGLKQELPAPGSRAAGATLHYKDIRFSYADDKEEGFQIGPISCTFRTGEIVFITGGNGSGKSTLAKVVTGLYSPQKGNITLNNEPVDAFTLAQQFTAIFSDYHLFSKLYGIDYEKKIPVLEDKLRQLRLDDKLEIKDGRFNTLSLSSGQRKRMALLVSYLEDKPFCFFDEWASDQDIEFRHFFYTTLLQELKKQHKAVIVISHDDRYFGVADRIYDMRMGMIVDRNVEAGIPSL